VLIPAGAHHVGPHVRALLEDVDAGVPGLLRVALGEAIREIGELEERIRAIERQLATAAEPALERITVEPGERGQGVVLTRSPFIDELVASGELITPFPKLRMPTGYQYALIANANTRDTPHVAAFCEWIRAEFAHGPLRQT